LSGIESVQGLPPPHLRTCTRPIPDMDFQRHMFWSFLCSVSKEERLFLVLLILGNWWQLLFQHLLKNVIKTYISHLVHTTRFWNNFHRVGSKSKDWKAK